MWILVLAACSTPEPPAPDLVSEPPAPEAPPAEPEPHGPPDRDPVVQTLTLAADPIPCEGCERLRLRPQASSAAMEADREKIPELATDGDAATAWCAVGGVGQRISFAMPDTFDVRRVHLELGDVDGSNPWTKAKLVTDRKDHLTLELAGPVAELAEPLAGVQFLQLEVLALADEGPACIRELWIDGVPSVERVEPSEP